MATDKVQEFLTALQTWSQDEITRMTADIAYTTLVHAARASVEGLAEDVRKQVEDDVAEILGIP